MAGLATIQKPEPIVDESTLDHRGPEFRQQIGKVSRQSFVYFAGRIFAIAAGYFFKVYLARKLGAEALGDYALGLTIIGSLGIFNAFGLPRSATRFAAAYRATGQFEMLRGFLIRSILILLASNIVFVPILLFVGPVIATHMYHSPELRNYLWLFALLMALGTLNTFLSEVLAGYKNVARSTVLTTFVGTPLMMFCTIALIFLGWGLRGYIFAQVLSGLVVLALFILAAWKQTPVSARSLKLPILPLEKRVVSFSASVFAMECLGFLISHTDKVFLGIYLNPKQVGIYALAAGVVALVPIILQSVNQIFSPIISDLHARRNYSLLARMFQTLTKWILGLTFPLAITVIVFAKPLMKIFGPEFEVGWPVLIVGTLGQLVNCGVGSAGYLLLMSGNEKRLLRIQLVTAFAMMSLSILLVPHWGILGAAIAAAITNVLQNLWFLKGTYEQLHLFPYNLSYVKLVPAFLASALALAGVAYFANGISKLVEISLGGLTAYVAFAITALLAGLDPDDRMIANAIWLRLRSSLPFAEANI